MADPLTPEPLGLAREALKDMTRIARAASIGVTGNAPRIAKAEAAIAALDAALSARPAAAGQPPYPTGDAAAQAPAVAQPDAEDRREQP